MLVRFDTKSATISMFGDVATQLLRLMGQTGDVPGAMLAADIPAAVQKLRQALAGEQAKPVGKEQRNDDTEPAVGLSQRAFPLIELLERAASRGDDVVWKQD